MKQNSYVFEREQQPEQQDQHWKEGKMFCLIKEIYYNLESLETDEQMTVTVKVNRPGNSLVKEIDCKLENLETGEQMTVTVKVDRTKHSQSVKPRDKRSQLVGVRAGGDISMDGVCWNVPKAYPEKELVERVGKKRGFFAAYDWFRKRGGRKD